MIRAAAGTAIRRVSSRQIQNHGLITRHWSTSIISRQIQRGTVQTSRNVEMNLRVSRPRTESLSSSSKLIESMVNRCYSSRSKEDVQIPNVPVLNVSNAISPSWYRVPISNSIPIRGFMLSPKEAHDCSAMFMQTRLLSTGRHAKKASIKGRKRVRKLKGRPPVKRPVLRERQKQSKLKAKPVSAASRKPIKKSRPKQYVYVPVKVRVKQKQERARALRAAAASRKSRWSDVDVAGYSSALIEKYAVPPIQTIKKLASVPAMNKGDLLSVLAILSLLLTIIFTPFAARYVWKSESEDYEELEWDDPVAQTEKDFRKHISRDLGEPVRLYLLEQWRKTRERHSQKAEAPDEQAADRPVAETIEEERPKKVPRTILNIESIMKEILESPILLDVVTDFIAQVLESQRVNGALQTVLRNLWRDLVNDPETTAQVVQLLHNGIQNREIKKSVRKLVLELINDREVYNELQLLVIRLGNEQEVLSATQALLTESAHKALNDPEILDHSMAFATDVVGDDVVQRTSGEALRNTLSYAVRPGFSAFLAIAGIALIIFSFSALGNARSSEQEAEMIDLAFSSMARSVQSSTARGVSAILSLPERILSFCATAVVSIVKAPFRLVSAAASAIGRAGNAASRTLSNWVTSVLAVPVMLFQGAFSFLARMGRSVSDEISNAVNGLVAAVSSSFVGSAARVVVGVCSGVVSAVWTGASTLGHVVSTGASRLSNAMTSAVTYVTTSGQSLSTHGSAMWRTISENFSAIATAAGQFLTQSKDVLGTFTSSVERFVSNSNGQIETVLARSSSFLNASFSAVASWCARIFRRDQKPDPI